MTPLTHLNATKPVLSPNGRWAVTDDPQETGSKVWDVRTGKVDKELIREHGWISKFFSQDGRWLLIATGTEFGIWEPGTWRPVRQIPREQPGAVPSAAAFAPDGQVLAVLESPAHDGVGDLRGAPVR